MFLVSFWAPQLDPHLVTSPDYRRVGQWQQGKDPEMKATGSPMSHGPVVGPGTFFLFPRNGAQVEAAVAGSAILPTPCVCPLHPPRFGGLCSQPHRYSGCGQTGLWAQETWSTDLVGSRAVAWPCAQAAQSSAVLAYRLS